MNEVYIVKKIKRVKWVDGLNAHALIINTYSDGSKRWIYRTPHTITNNPVKENDSRFDSLLRYMRTEGKSRTDRPERNELWLVAFDKKGKEIQKGVDNTGKTWYNKI